MISRRPNSRASRDKAPGPKAVMVPSIANPKAHASLQSKMFSGQPGSQEIAMPIAPTVAITPTIGVRKPISSRQPAASVPTPIIHAPGLALVSPT